METPSTLPGKGTWHIVTIAASITVVNYLLTRHPAYAFAVIPYVLMLTCLVMHLLENGSQGKHEHRDARNGP